MSNPYTITRSISYEDVATITPHGHVTLVEIAYGGPHVMPSYRHPGPGSSGFLTFLASTAELRRVMGSRSPGLPTAAVDRLETLSHYHVLTDAGARGLVDRPFGYAQGEALFLDARQTSAAVRDGSLDPGRVFHFDGTSSLLYGVDSGMPVPTVYVFDYFQVNNKFFTDSALRLLRKHPNVISAEVQQIPDYNDHLGTMGVRYLVLPPKDVFESWVWHFRDAIKEPFWTVRLAEMVSGVHHFDGVPHADWLGLSAARKGTEVTEVAPYEYTS